MVVSSLIVGFVLSMYLFSEKIMSHREKEAEVKDAVSECAQRILEDIHTSGDVIRCDDTSLVLEQNSLKRVNYHFVEDPAHGNYSQVRRNGVLLNSLQTELAAHVKFVEDTTTIQPMRYWEIHVAGRQGSSVDSTSVQTSTIISSQELVNRCMKGGS